MTNTLRDYLFYAEYNEEKERIQMNEKIVIVGASITGFYTAKALRKEGYTGSITLISQQSTLPYDLPPLSKEWMQATEERTPPLLAPETYYADENIQLKLETSITQIHPESHQIQTEQGEFIPYDKLVLAIGSTLRTLNAPGVDSNGIFYLRDFKNALHIKKQAKQTKEVVIIGAGFIGLELASTLSQIGLKVTVIEHADYPLGRILGEEASGYFTKMHREHGITLLTGEDLQAFTQDAAGNVTGALTVSGQVIPCQMALIGIGVVPNTSLSHPGLKVERGIVVNEYGETSLPDVYAAGDCTVWPYQRALIHVEHWEHARAHGRAVAKNLIQAKSHVYDVQPYFWTDEYDQTFEYLGHALSWDRILTRGSLDEKQFTLAYVDQENRPMAIFFANEGDKRKDVAAFMEQKRPINEEKFKDLTISLNDI